MVLTQNFNNPDPYQGLLSVGLTTCFFLLPQKFSGRIRIRNQLASWIPTCPSFRITDPRIRKKYLLMHNTGAFLCDSCCILEIDLVSLQRACCPYSHFSAGQVANFYSFFYLCTLCIIGNAPDPWCFGTDPDPRPVTLYSHPATGPDPALLFSGFQDANRKKFFLKVIFPVTVLYPQSIYISLQRLQVIKKPQNWGLFLIFFACWRKDPDPWGPKNLRIRNPGYRKRPFAIRFFSSSTLSLFLLYLVIQVIVWWFGIKYGIPDPDPTLQVAPDPDQILKLGKKPNFKCSHLYLSAMELF